MKRQKSQVIGGLTRIRVVEEECSRTVVSTKVEEISTVVQIRLSQSFMHKILALPKNT